ncbi:MAG: C4-dicarboxylate transporter DctA [Acidobacteriia bacterium]|nr:C4-dicarboxylate transporter DctA [Terriglobia bacterium]
MARRPWYRDLYVQVLAAIALGVFVGHFFPPAGLALRPLGEGFIALIKMMIGPVIFLVLVQGIASMGDMKKVGRVGVKTLIYFEVLSVVALLIGMAAAEVGHPGRGLNINAATLDAKAVAGYVGHVKDTGLVAQLLDSIPRTFLDAFVHDNFLQVVLLALLCGFAISKMGKAGEAVTDALGVAGKVCFGIIRMIVQLAPVGAFGAMAYTVARYDLASLSNLAKLVGTLYFTSVTFVAVILGSICMLAGFSLPRLLIYLKEEMLIVLGTSTSEVVIPDMLRKLEGLGAPRSIVGLVFPMGYTFNADGANIYITLAVLFLAQATNVHLTLGQEVRVLLFAMIAATGGAGVPGGAFVKVAAVLTVFPEIPVQALALLLAVDKFMSECRALTNVIGNAVATIVISRWEGEMDMEKMREVIGGR